MSKLFLKINLILVLIFYSIYILSEFINQKNDIQSYIRILVLILAILIILFMFTEKFEKNFYEFTIVFLYVGVLMKIIFDWEIYNIKVAFSTILVASVLTVNLNMGMINIFLINIIHFFQFVIRFKSLYIIFLLIVKNMYCYF